MFTWRHFLWLAICLLLAAGTLLARRRKRPPLQKVLTSALLLVYGMGFLSVYLNSLLASPTYVDGKLQHVDFWTNFFFTYQNPLNIRITALWQWYLYLAILLLLSAVLLYLFYWPLIRKAPGATGEGDSRS